MCISTLAAGSQSRHSPQAQKNRAWTSAAQHPVNRCQDSLRVRTGWYGSGVNDPSAGSPTETLLRLLLPLSDKVHQTFRYNVQELNTVAVRIIHRITQSVGATGGVYKGQGRNQHELMTRAY